MGRGGKNPGAGLQDLVLGNLVEEDSRESKEFTAFETVYEEHSLPYVVAEGRDLEIALKEDLSEEEILEKVGRQAALYLSLGRSANKVNMNIRPEHNIPSYQRHHPGVDLSFILLEYLRSPNAERLEELRLFIARLNNQIEMGDLVSSLERKIDYVQDYFDEDSVQIVSEVTGAKKATVQKWFEGSNPSSYNSTRISLLVKILYQAQAGMGLHASEVRDWYMGPVANLGNQSPHDILKQERSQWSLPRDLYDEMCRLGADFS